jgi:hypothetical protein
MLVGWAAAQGVAETWPGSMHRLSRLMAEGPISPGTPDDRVSPPKQWAALFENLVKASFSRGF